MIGWTVGGGGGGGGGWAWRTKGGKVPPLESIISSPNFQLKGFQEYSEVVFIPLTGGVILYNSLLSFEFVQEKPGNKVIFTIYKWEVSASSIFQFWGSLL